MIELNFVGLFLWPIQQLDEYLLENGGFPNRDTLNRHQSQFARKKLQGRDIQNLNIQAIRCLM